MTEFIDTHIHLYDKDFDEDREDVIERAKKAGIVKVILPGIDSTYSQKLENLAKEKKGFAFAATGLHPTSVNHDWEKELEFVINGIDTGKHIALGEIGLDCYWSQEFTKEQIIAFETQLEASATNDLPVIIHSRDATELVLQSLSRLKHLNLRGVFHAFSGSIETYNAINKYGDFMFGIGGVVTFKNSKLPLTIAKMDKKSLILETDAPWLSPAPFRGKRNEPANIRLIAQKIAHIKNCHLEEIAQITTENANRLFKFGK